MLLVVGIQIFRNISLYFKNDMWSTEKNPKKKSNTSSGVGPTFVYFGNVK